MEDKKISYRWLNIFLPQDLARVCDRKKPGFD